MCFYCGKTLGEWDADDDPFAEHKSHSTKCKFINMGRRESELKVYGFHVLLRNFRLRLCSILTTTKVKEFIDLVESWCMNKADRMMENVSEERSKIMNDLKNVVEAKFRK